MPTQCCVCGIDDADQIGAGEDFEYRTTDDTFTAVKCRSCSLVYLDPRPTLADMEMIYPPDYHAFDFSEEDYGLVHKIRSRLEAKRLLDYCGPLHDGARILDVGCGDGFHLRLLREFGNKSWQLEGIDLDRRAIDAAERSGLKVHYGSVESLGLEPEIYDVIYTIQTIEHVERPDKFLSALSRLIKPGGRVVIVTDNTDSLDFGLFKKGYWGGYHFPRHLNLFNKASLTKLAQKNGLLVEGLTTIVSPVNWVYSIHNALVDNRAPKFVIDRFTLKSFVSLSVFTMLDIILQKAKRGALLRATLQKPAVS